MTVNYDSVPSLLKILSDNGLSLKKQWGQNFLINKGVREKIISYLDIQPGELVWEIGPGLGAMTALLLDMDIRVIAFEVDRGMLTCLHALYPQSERFNTVQGDVVKTWQSALDQWGTPSKILGNLPYSCASAIIASFVTGALFPAKMVFTVQKELAERLTSTPSHKNYSSFSIFCQFSYIIRNLGIIAPNSFFPVPEVMSSIIELQQATHSPLPIDKDLFFLLVRSAFHARRKTLRNNLLHSEIGARYSKDLILGALESEKIADDIRGETLTVADFIRLANTIKQL